MAIRKIVSRISALYQFGRFSINIQKLLRFSIMIFSIFCWKYIVFEDPANFGVKTISIIVCLFRKWTYLDQMVTYHICYSNLKINKIMNTLFLTEGCLWILNFQTNNCKDDSIFFTLSHTNSHQLGWLYKQFWTTVESQMKQ